MEKAGPVYQFTHDILADSIYEYNLSNNELFNDKMKIHKILGLTLLNAADDNSTTHLLAMDQINKCEVDGFSPEERMRYSNSNVDAALFSIAASSFAKG